MVFHYGLVFFIRSFVSSLDQGFLPYVLWGFNFAVRILVMGFYIHVDSIWVVLCVLGSLLGHLVFSGLLCSLILSFLSCSVGD